MKFLLPLRRGLAGALRQPKLVFLVYLLGLVPALVVALLAYADLAPLLNDSAFAAQAFAGERMSVWNDYQRASGSDFALVTRAAMILALGLLVLHVLTAAGVVESLLHRERRREHPFLLGVGRHGWRFTRSAIWFLLAMVPLVVAFAAAFPLTNKLAEAQRDGRLHLAGWLVAVLVALVVWMFLDLAYDLSRVAAATHDEGRTFFGFFRALFHALRHPLLLGPFWLLLVLVGLGLHLTYVAVRAAVQPENLGQMMLVLVAQQLVFFLAAYLRVSMWAGEIAYYQAVGEPRWCGRRETKVGRYDGQRDAALGEPRDETAVTRDETSVTRDDMHARHGAAVLGADPELRREAPADAWREPAEERPAEAVARPDDEHVETDPWKAAEERQTEPATPPPSTGDEGWGHAAERAEPEAESEPEPEPEPGDWGAEDDGGSAPESATEAESWRTEDDGEAAPEPSAEPETQRAGDRGERPADEEWRPWRSKPSRDPRGPSDDS